MAGKQHPGGPQAPTSPSLGRGSIPPSPDGPTLVKDISPTETPRKNKRKLSEPRKRTDFSIKRFCPDSPGSAMSDSGCSEDFEGVQENPPQTPDNFAQEQENSSQGRDDTPNPAALHFLQGMRANCIVPNLFINKNMTSTPLIHGFPGFPLGALPEGFHNGFTHEQLELMSRAGVHGLTAHPDDDDDDDDDELSEKDGKKQRKNYKNMTRERRVEANARERSRVHTISAAFDALRKAVPSYSYNQKLSKLAILRIACSYILALGRLANVDYAKSVGSMSFSDCVDMCTSTIQTEGRARRRH